MPRRQDATAAQLSFSPTCPSGGTWQVCGSNFAGCCAGDACTRSGCVEGNLYPVAFDSTQHGKFPDASCGLGISFWTCGFGPTFWGCCKTNPCAAGAVCPRGDLAAAHANGGDPVQQAYYLGGSSGPISITSASPSATSTSTNTGTLVTSIASLNSLGGSTSSPTTTPVASSPQPASHTAAIAGGSAAGGVFVALLVCWLIYYLCYVKRSRKIHNDALSSLQSDLPVATMTEKPDNATTATQGYDAAPPGYCSPNPSTYPHQRNEVSSYVYPHATANPAAWKPQHRHGLSELSEETVWRSELESPVPSPRVGCTP